MRNDKLMIRVGQQEKKLILDAAKNKGLPVASWARQELVRAARQKDTAKPIEVQQDLELLSLFCGPGGLDEGFRKAGFRTRLAFDIDEECVNTFQANHPEAKAHVHDITKLSLSQIDKLAGKTFAPVGIIGGPPCQSFSVSNVHQSDDDPRHLLPEAYAGLLKKLNKRSPISFFVFENVPGLLGKKHIHRYEKFKKLFKQAGFTVHEQLLDAKDFEVPQERPRIIIVGINHEKHPNKVWIPPVRVEGIKTVRDAIGNLPEPVYNGREVDPETIPVHPNHWCLVPRSEKFATAKLYEGQMFGRSFRTLTWDKPSWTVAYGHREVHVHPNGLRRLSIYEAMLLQTFPHTYRLTGNMSAQIRLISEAVPPMLAFHIAQSVRASLGI